MWLFITGVIAGASVLAGVLIVLSEPIRAALRRRCQSAEPNHQAVQPAQVSASPRVTRATRTVTDDERAAVYREILEALGDDLEEDLAEWKAVLEEFPPFIGAEELPGADDRPREATVKSADVAAAELPCSQSEPIVPLQRTRRLSADERGMIQRLLKTGFAPEEIALWLNLPLERVQEFLLRG